MLLSLSPALVKTLYENQTYATGIARQSRKGMPALLKTTRLHRGESKGAQQGPILAVKFRDRREITMLTTQSRGNICSRTSDRGQDIIAPKVVHVYNKLMGAVDVADQLRHEYDADRKSVKLWKKLLLDILLRMTGIL